MSNLRHELASNLADLLDKKERHYGSSWKKRGGVGAFMMLARKWDRIENIAQRYGWDILDAGACNDADVMDDITDLMGYLLLVAEEVAQLHTAAEEDDPSAPGPGYVDQDRDDPDAASWRVG